MYYVKISCAKMPNSVRVPYRHIAVVQANKMPKMISERCGKIIQVWGRKHLGFRPGGNTAAEVATREAIALAMRLNLAEKFGS